MWQYQCTAIDPVILRSNYYGNAITYDSVTQTILHNQVPYEKSCLDLEKNLGKIFSRFCKNLARNQAIQGFHMDLEQESCKVRFLQVPKVGIDMEQISCQI